MEPILAEKVEEIVSEEEVEEKLELEVLLAPEWNHSSRYVVLDCFCGTVVVVVAVEDI